ncbi:uncharacterized protein MKZ38_006340 [Zalerion maritima]|uniref:Ubiquitin-like domain-containing protein n=1 Tax=Zalerion maritima TaxID=339359 RepID=A0AAD5RX60_9PEZI|nr:uncharacterized protein MKZ38_006340 [Zalerion maritima]
MADSTHTGAPPSKRFQFKKTIKPRKAKSGSENPLELFAHSKTSFARFSEEKRQHLEAEKKRLAEENKRRAAKESSRDSDEDVPLEKETSHRATRSTSFEGADVLSSSLRSTPSKKRKSNIFNDSNDDDEHLDVTQASGKSPRMSGALSADTPTKLPGTCPRQIVQLSDSEDDNVLYSPQKTKATNISPRLRRSVQLPTPDTPVISLDDDDDDDDEPIMTKEKKATVNVEPSEMEVETQRFIAEAKKRLEANKAGNVPVVKILVAPRIQNTKEMMVRIRLNQEMSVIKKTWAHTNGFDPENIYFTWRGKRIHNYTTCQALGIDATEDERAVPVKKNTRYYHREEGFRNEAVLVEAWTKELLDEHQREAEEERRKLNGEFVMSDYITRSGDALENGEKTQVTPKIRLTLKTKTGDLVKVSVRPSTTVKELVASFRASRKLGDETAVCINFDGDNLGGEQTVKELDIEDLDVLDVIVK